jgi:hypothetical protein
MPRYYLHVRRGQAAKTKRNGIELAGTEEAAKDTAQRRQQIAARGPLNSKRSNPEIVIIGDDWQVVLDGPALRTADG